MMKLIEVHQGDTNPFEGNKHQIEEIILHEKFDYITYDNDIALVKVNPPFVFTRGSSRTQSVVPVCLPSKSEPKIGSPLVVAGWGFTEKTLTVSERLRFAFVNVFDKKKCTKYEFFNPKTQMCVGVDGGGIDACQVRLFF